MNKLYQSALDRRARSMGLTTHLSWRRVPGELTEIDESSQRTLSARWLREHLTILLSFRNQDVYPLPGILEIHTIQL